MKSLRARSYHGFTVVELLIVIAVIAILAVIVAVVYNGVQQRSVATTLQQDLGQLRTIVETDALANGGLYPEEIPAEFRPSQGVNITAASSSGGGHSGLTGPENALLFKNVCSSLMPVTPYWNTCDHWDTGGIQLTGNQGAYLTSPITEASRSQLVSCTSCSDPYTIAANQFYDQLLEQFAGLGGTFPVVMYAPWEHSPSLPELAPAIDGYCYEARHNRFPDIVWHLRIDTAPNEGTC